MLYPRRGRRERVWPEQGDPALGESECDEVEVHLQLGCVDQRGPRGDPNRLLDVLSVGVGAMGFLMSEMLSPQRCYCPRKRRTGAPTLPYREALE